MRDFVLLLIVLTHALAVSPRHLIHDGVALSTGGSVILAPSEPAGAARGAAELDFEYYMRISKSFTLLT